MTIRYVLFVDGIAQRVDTEPFAGSEEVTLPPNVALPERFLRSHRRLADGSWERLPPAPDPVLTPEQIAEKQAEEARIAAELAEEQEFRLMKRLLRLMHRRNRGEITQAQYIAQSDVIIASFVA